MLFSVLSSTFIGLSCAFSCSVYCPYAGVGLGTGYLNGLQQLPIKCGRVSPLTMKSSRFYMGAARNEIEVNSLPSYEAVGRKLMEGGYYQGIIDGIIDCCERDGFMMIDSPSGSGKTQAGVALKLLDYTRPDNLAYCSSLQLRGKKFRVVHLVWDRNVDGQVVYREIVRDSLAHEVYNKAFFASCRTFANANSGKEDSLEDEVWEKLLQPLFENFRAPDFDVTSFRRKHNLEDAILVLFVDEFPNLAADVQAMLVVREALRPLANVVTILAGTSAKASNAVSLRVGYSSTLDYVPKWWSLLVTRLPAFRLEFSPSICHQWETIMAKLEQGDDPDLKAIVSIISVSLNNGGNPRLIVFAIQALTAVLLKPPLYDPGTSLWSTWQLAFSNTVTTNRFAMTSSWCDASEGLRSQLNLLCEASMRRELSDVILASHFGFRAVPDGGSCSSTSKNARLVDCGGWLYIAEVNQRIFGRRLQYISGPCMSIPLNGNHEWETTVFAPFQQDPLLYLGCCRQGGFFNVQSAGTTTPILPPLLAHEVVLNLWSENSAGSVDFPNPCGLSNTGSMLEVACTVASCNAAAAGSASAQNLPLSQFFGNLMVQLGLPIESDLAAGLLRLDESFLHIFVPRCAFPGTEVPADWTGRIALVSRMPDSDQYGMRMHGVLGRCAEIRGEAQDRAKFGTDELAKAILRLSCESEIGFILVRGCNQYWAQGKNDAQRDLVKTNLDSLRETLSRAMQEKVRKECVTETVEVHCNLGRIVFFSKDGDYAELDLQNGKEGRIVVIQVPPAALGYAAEASDDSDAEA